MLCMMFSSALGMWCCAVTQELAQTLLPALGWCPPGPCFLSLMDLVWSESEIHQHPALPHSKELLYIPEQLMSIKCLSDTTTMCEIPVIRI